MSVGTGEALSFEHGVHFRLADNGYNLSQSLAMNLLSTPSSEIKNSFLPDFFYFTLILSSYSFDAELNTSIRGCM